MRKAIAVMNDRRFHHAAAITPKLRENNKEKKSVRKALIIVCVILFVQTSLAPAFGQTEKKELSGNIALSGAWALYPMALKWAEEFQKIYPGVKIDIQAGGAGKGIADTLASMVDVGMVSRDINPAELEKGAFPLAVTKDAVIPTIHAKNPFLKQILKRGIKKEEFVSVWITGTAKTWEQILGGTGKTDIHVYTRSDACGAAETWAAYLGKRQEDLGGIGVYGDPGLADAVRRDPLGIGYNNVNFAYDAKTKAPVEGLTILPLDLDGNGTLEAAEQVYATRDDITTAIAANVYPSPPARELFFVTKGKPTKPALVEFLKWVLGEGQKYVLETGYINLSADRLKEGLQRIGL
jgi:phosphate transport system substrate-binding protein